MMSEQQTVVPKWNDDIVVIQDQSEREALPEGLSTKLRVLPNHACATAVQHAKYEVVDADGEHILASWPRINSW